MGAGVPEGRARAGLDVVVVEVDDAAADRARARIESSVERGVERGKLDAGCGRHRARAAEHGLRSGSRPAAS